VYRQQPCRACHARDARRNRVMTPPKPICTAICAAHRPTAPAFISAPPAPAIAAAFFFFFFACDASTRRHVARTDTSRRERGRSNENAGSKIPCCSTYVVAYAGQQECGTQHNARDRQYRSNAAHPFHRMNRMPLAAVFTSPVVCARDERLMRDICPPDGFPRRRRER